MSTTIPEMVADYRCMTGEGPLWHPSESKLYWVDIPTGRMFRYSPDSGRHEQFYKGDVVGGFTIQADGALLLFMERGAVRVWRDGTFSTIIPEIREERSSRFNDVIADPMGRVFCGTMPSRNHLGSLYRLERDGNLVKILDGVGCPNGMGFTPDGKGMYFTDSAKREIYLFDYRSRTGDVTNRKLFLRLPGGDGTPDGMTVDSHGFVWSAIWDGSRLGRYGPDGKEDMHISFPARKVSSVTFGGNGCKDIYVTTAGGDKKESEGPGAGGLFRLALGVKGLPEHPSKVGL